MFEETSEEKTSEEENKISPQSLESINKDFVALLSRRSEMGGQSFCEETRNKYNNLPFGLRVILELEIPSSPKFVHEERLRTALENAEILIKDEESAKVVIQSPYQPHEQTGDSSVGRKGLMLNRNAIQQSDESPDYDLEEGATGRTIHSLEINPLGTFSNHGLEILFIYPKAVTGISVSNDRSIPLSPIALEYEDEILPVREWDLPE